MYSVNKQAKHNYIDNNKQCQLFKCTCTCTLLVLSLTGFLGRQGLGGRLGLFQVLVYSQEIGDIRHLITTVRRLREREREKEKEGVHNSSTVWQFRVTEYCNY